MMSVEEIYNKGWMSQRSYNICKRYNFKTILCLRAFYNKHSSFEGLKNCGAKSNKEFINICRNYEYSAVNNHNAFPVVNNLLFQNVTTPSISQVIELLTGQQRKIINNYIFYTHNLLSVRSRNAISKYFEGDLTLKNFTEKIFKNDFKAIYVSNIGIKSLPELEKFISGVEEFILAISKTKTETELTKINNKFLLLDSFPMNEVPLDIIESDSIFKISNFIIMSDAIFNDKQKLIAVNTINIYQIHHSPDFDFLMSELKLSKERIRQLRIRCLELLKTSLVFIKNIKENLYEKYNIDLNSELIEVNEELVCQVNKHCKTNFSKNFISYILGIYLNGSYMLVGNIEDVLQPKATNNISRHNWNNFYIVNNKLEKFDFTSFADDIDERLSERLEETYLFNFKSYLSKFICNPDIELIELAFPIAEKILNDEFGLCLDINDNVVFERNTFKQAFEYAYEALELLGKPSKVEEITQKIIELHPDYETDDNKVRASMKRKDGFVPVGRTSVFGLKKWENELDDFKGGTIRSISYEFLEQFDTPKHITEIIEYVLKYRPNSNDKSIYYNLRIEESEIFSFFKNSYVGLKNKNYSEDFEVLKDSDMRERGSWEERYDDLQKFLLLENRLPFSNGVPKNEIRLYRWLNVQKGKLKTKILDEQKEKLIIEIFEKFRLINVRRRLNSSEKYDELLE